MKKGNGKSRFFVTLIVIILVLVVLAIALFVVAPKLVKNSVCVSRSISGESEREIILDVDFSLFKKPSSLIVEERIPSQWNFVDTDPKALFAEENKASWMFWSGGEKVRDVKIIYHVENAVSGEPVGKLITAKEKGNPETGYNEVEIGPGEVCL